MGKAAMFIGREQELTQIKEFIKRRITGMIVY